MSKLRSKIKLHSSQRGSVLAFALVAVLILACAWVIIDFARVKWLEASVRYSLSLGIRRAESDERLFPLSVNDDYVQARKEVEQFVFSNDTFRALQSSHKILPVEQEGGTLKIAYLPPGQTGNVILSDGSRRAIANSHVSTPGAHSLRALSSNFPTEITIFLEVDTFLLGKQVVPVVVAGYPRLAKIEVLSTATTTTATVTVSTVVLISSPTPTPTGTPTATPSPTPTPNTTTTTSTTVTVRTTLITTSSTTSTSTTTTSSTTTTTTSSTSTLTSSTTTTSISTTTTRAPTRTPTPTPGSACTGGYRYPVTCTAQGTIGGAQCSVRCHRAADDVVVVDSVPQGLNCSGSGRTFTCSSPYSSSFTLRYYCESKQCRTRYRKGCSMQSSLGVLGLSCSMGCRSDETMQTVSRECTVRGSSASCYTVGGSLTGIGICSPPQ